MLECNIKGERESKRRTRQGKREAREKRWGIWCRPIQFVCSASISGKQPKDGKKPEPCKPILKVEYKTTRAG